MRIKVIYDGETTDVLTHGEMYEIDRPSGLITSNWFEQEVIKNKREEALIEILKEKKISDFIYEEFEVLSRRQIKLIENILYFNTYHSHFLYSFLIFLHRT